MFSIGHIFIYADHDFFVGIQLSLKSVSSLRNFHLREALFNRRNHAAHFVNLMDVVPGFLFHFIGERFDEVGTGQGVDGIGYSRLFSQNLLRAQGDFYGMFGRQTEDFIQRVGMKRLGAT